jgi:L-lactate utilization protein LutB
MTVVDQAKNAAEFLNDRTHEQHLDQLMWMLRTRRDEAASRVAEWEQLRDLASAIKEHALSNLAHYLEMFESRAQANGVTVHWAQDAHEHNQIVYQLLSDRKVDLLIKSKSMLTEECDTRPFLETRGIQFARQISANGYNSSMMSHQVISWVPRGTRPRRMSPISLRGYMAPTRRKPTPCTWQV